MELKKTRDRLAKSLKETPRFIKTTWQSFGRIKKILFVFCVSAVIAIVGMRLLALNYQRSESDQEYQYGTTFVSNYATSLGLDPKEAYSAILNEIPIKNIRLVSYWSEGERERGVYDLSELDWQIEQAKNSNIKISLALGLRQPRYPECHMPEWSKSLTKDQWYPELKNYLTYVVNRYKDESSIISYQLENEFFLDDFGVCPDHSRDRLVEEFNLVKSIDPDTPIILSRSNNYGGFAINEPQADIYGISVYRKVHNPTLGYVTYPFPAWYYAFLAQGQSTLSGKPSIIHEFQLEPWLKSGSMQDSSIEEQNKTMNVKDVEANINFAKKTGIKEIYFWGSEWWYWRKTNGDPTIWDTVKSELS